jgi:hypothetical protein
MKEKLCTKCKVVLPISNFNVRVKGGSVYSSACKVCKNKIVREFTAKRKAEELSNRPIKVNYERQLDIVEKYISRWYA